jgi:hypothetical protein
LKIANGIFPLPSPSLASEFTASSFMTTYFDFKIVFSQTFIGAKKGEQTF